MSTDMRGIVEAFERTNEGSEARRQFRDRLVALLEASQVLRNEAGAYERMDRRVIDWYDAALRACKGE